MAALGAVLGIVVTSGPLGPVWDVLPVLSKLQFPWRLTAVVTLLLAALVARLELRRAWSLVVLTALAAAPFSSWGRTVPASAFLPPRPAESEEGTIFPDPLAAWQAGSGGWYWRHENLAEPWLLPRDQPPSLLANLAGTPSAELDKILNRPAVFVEDPDTEVRVVQWGQIERTLEIDAPHDGSLLWRVIPFPEMAVWVDGVAVDGVPDPATGLLSHRVPEGVHRARWMWKPFPAVSRGRWISLMSGLLLVMLAAGALVRRFVSAG